MKQLRIVVSLLYFLGAAFFFEACADASGEPVSLEKTGSPDVISQTLVGRGEIPNTTTAPVVDGSPDADWSAVSARTATRTFGGPAVPDSDLSASWKVSWDATAIYFLVDVLDDQSRQDSPQPWDDDSVEVYLDADNSHATSYDGRNDFQLLFRPGSTRVEFGTRSLQNGAGIRFATLLRAGGYTTEIAIPWSTLGVSALAGQSIGVDVHVNDDDNGGTRDGKLATFATRDDSWTNPSLFGVLRMGAPADAYRPIAAASRAPTIDADIDADVWSAASVRPITIPVVRTGPAAPSVSGSWRAVWDSSALYILVDVADSVISLGSPSPWDDDAVEIFLDGDNSRGASYDGRNDFQFLFRVDDPALGLGQRSATNTAGVRFSLRRLATTGYRLEAAIPWAILGATPQAGTTFGIDVQIDDDDNGGTRDSKIATFATVDDAWTNPSRLEPLKLEGAPTQVCTVDTDRELMIRDLSVVEDPLRTRFDGPASDPRTGAWTFGKLVEQLAPTPAQAPALVEQLFRSWETTQAVNGFSIPARPLTAGFVLDRWPRRADGQLDLTRAPLLLLAIVNRTDLRDLARGRAGEGRFVFGVLSPDGLPTNFTVIMEYRLPATTTDQVVSWANSWHQLASRPFPSESYNAALQAVTDRFAGRGAEPGRVNGSALSQLRTNELALTPPWELREFELSPGTGFLQPSTVKLTPDTSFLQGGPLIDAFVNQNEAAILAQQHTVPLLFQGTPLLGGNSLNSVSFWSSGATVNPEARHLFSLNTCNGCHGAETQTIFLHINPRSSGTVASLSGFLTGLQVSDPSSGQQRSFDDLGRRNVDLRNIVCPQPTLARVAAGSRDAFLSKGIGRVH